MWVQQDRGGGFITYANNDELYTYMYGILKNENENDGLVCLSPTKRRQRTRMSCPLVLRWFYDPVSLHRIMGLIMSHVQHKRPSTL